MINKNHAEDIRICQRIKFDQALYILTMYQKKIRKTRNNSTALIDADSEMQDIICQWKNKWKMDLTKPILNCVTSVYPRILIDFPPQPTTQMNTYYSMISKFINRLRTEHEDQTNFKLVMLHYDKKIKHADGDKYLISSKATVKGFFIMAKQLANSMLVKISQNNDLIAEEMYSEVDTQNHQWQIWRPLRYIREISIRALKGDNQNEMQLQNDIEPKCKKTQQLVSFSSNIIRIMQRIKQSQHGSTLITIQPKIDQLTLMIHPLLIAVSANFKKENVEKGKNINWGNIEVEGIPMMENMKSSYNCSKVAFINLDGYESEFNLQFARNFKKHFLYVSFPKQDAKLDETKQIYSKRFFKKLMFRYTQATYESYADDSMSEEYKKLSKMDRLSFNPQDYHYNVEKLYQRKSQKNGNLEDFNQNIYVFPVRMRILREKFKQIMESKNDIQSHESHFIRFIIKDFILNQIREFNPTIIMVSYSGRLQIQDNHFVQIMQQLTKIANYKLIFYPNLTTSFLTQQMMQIQDQEGEQCDYDNFVNDSRIKFNLAGHEDMAEQNMEGIKMENWIELFNKMAIFLKVSSGTYNLTRHFEEEPLVSKYKNQFILTYADQLMTVLGQEYPNIDKIRFKNKDLSILPKLFESNINSIIKTFEYTVPKLYFKIYEIIQYLLFDLKLKPSQQKQQLLNSYKISKTQYNEQLMSLYSQILNKSNYEIVLLDSSMISQQIEIQKNKKMKQMFKGFKQSHLFQISSQKYEDKVSIFIKTNTEVKQYEAIAVQTQSVKGLFDVMFFLQHTKSHLKLYDSTKLLYKTNQLTRQSNKIPILIMNNLTDIDSTDSSFENYYTQLDITVTLMPAEKQNIEQKKCIVHQLVLKDQEGNVEGQKERFIYSEWNYCETGEWMILYWPSKYDFVRAFLLKMMNKPYEPQIINSFYFYQKKLKNHTFKKQKLSCQTSISARVGTSCYQCSQKLYIFGGFYAKQMNYLQLQHDIITVDLMKYQNEGREKLVLSNVKNQLYSRQAFHMRLDRKQKNNSFVRPRMEIEFFDKQQLYSQQTHINEQQYKCVIMFGGYGQNFLRPYSLLTYYYYILKFNRTTRDIYSIEKKLIYNKAVPINTKQITKNLGVIRTNRKTKNGILEANKLTDSDSYTLFRNSFKIETNNGQQQFLYKFKYMFYESQAKSFKQQIKKIQDSKTQQLQSSLISVEKIPGNNHMIILQKDGNRVVVSLRLQVPIQKAKKLDGFKQVNLTHQSIICLDIWNSYICAIIKHELYTQGKSVLVQYSINCLQNLNFVQDDVSHITMTWIKSFDFDLTLHILIIGNINTIAILHGDKIYQSDKVKEYIIVKKKKNKNQPVAYEISSRQSRLKKQMFSQSITTVFFRNMNKIISLDFMSISSSNYFYITCHEIDLTTSHDNFKWNQSHLDKFNPHKLYQFYLRDHHIVNISKLKFLQFMKYGNDFILHLQYNKHVYVCELNCKEQVLEMVDVGQFMLDKDKQSGRVGLILAKTEENYRDRDFQ